MRGSGEKERERASDQSTLGRAHRTFKTTPLRHVAGGWLRKPTQDSCRRVDAAARECRRCRAGAAAECFLEERER